LENDSESVHEFGSTALISLAPGFNRVDESPVGPLNLFNGLIACGETVETVLDPPALGDTRLKPGANETAQTVFGNLNIAVFITRRGAGAAA
jgi:hypothetical protein